MKKQPTDLRGKLCVVGGGAAGLMTACLAAEKGVSTVLFERNASQKELSSEKAFDNAYLGKKLLITGKGRCNLTNACNREEFLKNIPRNGKFLFAAFSAFPPDEVMKFFESHGLPVKVERGNRVFPVSDKALDVLRLFKRILRENGVQVIRTRITDIAASDGRITALTDENGREYLTDCTVLATGGLSYPVTGSDGDGYRFAETLGHTVTERTPSLVPLRSDDSFCRQLQGLSLKNVRLTLKNSAGKTVYQELGEMLFTHFGVSGPLVLSASAHITGEAAGYTVLLDLKPALDEKTLDRRILSDFSENPNRDYKNALSGLLPAKLIPVFVRRSGIPPEVKVNSITKAQRGNMVRLLKEFSVSVSGFSSIDEAIITRGGVKVSEVNPSTMESKQVTGLYFAGEILDVDGYTGGFNLQIAFSTAALAAKAVVQQLSRGEELQHVNH